ncbi:MAG TPA: M48 family metallopeptidase [Phycisphaerae bacterium]|nr:M48 family metalloprotease [Phycisphaerae bacterium]HOI54912.1 M48 family metallopeptidase [Phycisphaerae bacterium]
MPIRVLVAILLSLSVSAAAESSPGSGVSALWAPAAATVLIVAVGLGLWGRLARHIRRMTDIESLFVWHGRAMALYAWLAILVYAAVVFVGEWPEAVFAWLPPWRGTDLWLQQRLLILAPYLWLVLITWVIGYRMSSAVRRAAEIGWGGRRPQVRLGRYLVFQVRSQWLVFLVPYGFVLACHNAAVVVWGGLSAEAETAALAAPMILVYVLSPWLLRVAWSTSRLPDGPLRQRLEAAARRAGVYVRDIIVWRTGGLMVNACVAGLGRPLRYVFLTDTLIESLQPVQVEAVFAHELGHARFHHIPFFFVVAVGGGMGMSLVAAALDALLLPETAVLGGGIVFLAGYWLGFFGFLSRRFERQSDLFAARTVDCPGRRFEGACAMHRPESVAADDPYLVCGHQAWAFTSSLEQIALLNGMAARARSWRHFGIARRMRFIDDAVGRPDRVRRYDRRLRLLKWLILAAVLAATAAVALLSGMAEFL